MSGIVPADLVDAVKERSEAKLRMLMSEVATRQTRPDGTTYGDVTLSRDERIARFFDLAQRGVLDHLKVVKLDLLERMSRQYIKDVIGVSFETHPEAARVHAQADAIVAAADFGER